MRGTIYGVKPGLVAVLAGFAVAGLAGDLARGAAGLGDSVGWANLRGPDHNGISVEKDWFTPGAKARIAWRTSVGDGYSSVAVVGGRIYTMGYVGKDDVVYCLDARQGTNVIWRHAYPCSGGQYPGPRATPTLDGDAVYTFSRDGDLLCLAAEDGKVRWSRALAKELKVAPPGWGFASSALVLQNTVFVNAGAHGVAINKQSGVTLWESGVGIAGYATPVPFTVAGKPALLVFAGKSMEVVDAATGKELQRHPWETGYDVNAADPLVVGPDRFFISTGYQRGCAMLQIAEDKLTVKWENKNMSTHFSSCVLWNGYIYGFDGNVGKGDLKCLDAETGEVKWSDSSLGFGGLMLADGKLVVLTERGDLAVVAATPQGFQQLFRENVMKGTCWTAPVVAGGRVYCRNDKGELVCVDLTGK